MDRLGLDAAKGCQSSPDAPDAITNYAFAAQEIIIFAVFFFPF
jgi:hypothetical protein